MDPELVKLQREAEAQAFAARLGMTSGQRASGATAVRPPPRTPIGAGARQPPRGAVRADGSAETPQPSRQAEYVDDTPRRPRRSEIEIEAEGELDHHWVTVVSIERPVPRHFGDNRGMLPIWVEAHADWRQSGRTFDQQQPSEAMRAIRLAVLGCRSDAHARRLKAALDEALVGRASDLDADPLRLRFRNGIDFGDLDGWWTPLLLDVLLRCEAAATDFEVFNRADHERMVAERVALKVRLQKEGRR